MNPRLTRRPRHTRSEQRRQKLDVGRYSPNLEWGGSDAVFGRRCGIWVRGGGAVNKLLPPKGDYSLSLPPPSFRYYTTTLSIRPLSLIGPSWTRPLLPRGTLWVL